MKFIIGLILGMLLAWGGVVTYRSSITSVQVPGESSVTSETQLAMEGNEMYTNDTLGFSFSYPENWLLTESSVAEYPESQGVLAFAQLFSSDYVYDETASVCGGIGGVTSGSAVTLWVTDVAKDTSGNSVQSILDGTYGGKSVYSQQKPLVIGDGGVEYISRYEGPGSLVSVFERGGVRYAVTLGESCNSPGLPEKAVGQYREIVSSFKFF